MPQLKLSDKPARADEPPAEPPARPPDVLCPGLPNHVHWYHRTLGRAHEVGYGAAPYSRLPVSQCAYCRSGLDEGLNGSGHGYKSKPVAGLKLFEGAP